MAKKKSSIFSRTELDSPMSILTPLGPDDDPNKVIARVEKDGVITEMSICYDTITEGWEKGIRHLRELRLWDASPVTFAANPEASITGVKADLEHLLKSGRVLSATNKDKVQAAINALQALLDNADDNDSSKSTQEPAPTTPEPEKVKEAAELEGILHSIEAELAHFDTKAAEDRINQLLEKITTEV